MFQIRGRDILIPLVIFGIIMFASGCGVSACIKVMPNANFRAAWESLWSNPHER